MQFATKLTALLACIILGFAVFELVRKKRIREDYSLIWLGVVGASSLLVVFDKLANKLIFTLGGVNLSSLFFFGGVAFSVVMLLNFTIQISDLKKKQNVLIQEIGLLRQVAEVATRDSDGDKKMPGGDLC